MLVDEPKPKDKPPPLLVIWFVLLSPKPFLVEHLSCLLVASLIVMCVMDGGSCVGRRSSLS